MPRHRIPDFFDPKSRRLTEDILSGKTPLVDVNRPGVSPNVLRFFQDPRNRALVTRPLAGGLDRVANQAAVDRRVTRTPTPQGGGIPRRRADEGLNTEGSLRKMQERLRRGGKTLDEAVRLSIKRFRLDFALERRRARRDQRLSELDERRRAAGRPTSEDREAQRQEAFRSIRERKGIFLEDVNRRRKAQGLKPFGPVVQGRGDDGPVEVTDLDEVNERNGFGSGSVVRDPDGQLWRYNRIDGIDSYTPMVTDVETGLTVTDMDQIEFDEFVEALDDSERRAWREIIRRHSESTGDHASQRKILDVNNERTGVSRIPGGRKKDEEQRADGREQLDDKEARVFFDYAKDVGLNLTEIRQEQSKAEIEQQKAEDQARQDREKEQVQERKDRASAAEKDIKQATENLASRDTTAGREITVPTQKEILDEVRRIRAIRAELLGAVQPNDRQIIDIMNQVPIEPSSIGGVTVEQEKERLVDISTLRPSQQGTNIDRETALRIVAHVERFHPQLTDDQQRRDMARRITDELGWVR